MNYWHLQMWLPQGRGGIEIDSLEMLKQTPPVIGTGEWNNYQCRDFKYKIQIGDIICVKEGSKPIALCEVTSDNFNDNLLEKKYLHQNYRTVKLLGTISPSNNFPQPQGTLSIAKNKNTNTWKFIDKWYNLYLNKKNMIKYISILKSNKNIIFTGAPGTGKTYLAKQIALQLILGKDNEENLSEQEQKLFNQHYGFVQFHPSYDYTDFVEGLRPIKKESDELGFELKNGIFKGFCKKALEKESENNFDDIYEQFIDDLSENNLELETPTHKRKFKVEINSNKTCVAIPNTESATRMSITKEMIRSYVINEKILDWKPYTIPIGDYIKDKYNLKLSKTNKSDLPYIFIIDEINRAEISKVFGELFFAIDPGYRGEKGKVKTQYTNIQTEKTYFVDIDNDYFFIPENVLIIGTMNDIDRSVDTFDFAMRRRFAWIKIKATDRISMLNDNLPNDLKKEALKRMNDINKVIEQTEGLNEDYHIGPAYFLKLNIYKDSNDPFMDLWNNHIEILLKEYLRGISDIDDKINFLKKAFFNSNE